MEQGWNRNRGIGPRLHGEDHRVARRNDEEERLDPCDEIPDGEWAGPDREGSGAGCGPEGVEPYPDDGDGGGVEGESGTAGSGRMPPVSQGYRRRSYPSWKSVWLAYEARRPADEEPVNSEAHAREVSARAVRRLMFGLQDALREEWVVKDFLDRHRLDLDSLVEGEYDRLPKGANHDKRRNARRKGGRDA